MCKAAATPGENQLFKCDSCSSVMLRSNLRRKVLRRITISPMADVDRDQFNCHTSVLSHAFPERNIEQLDVDQLSLLILTHRYNITYEPSTGNIVTLMPLMMP